MNALQQVLARKGRPIIICSKGDEETKKLGYFCLEIPTVPDCLAGILTVIPLQLLSFHLAVLRGYDVRVHFNLRTLFLLFFSINTLAYLEPRQTSLMEFFSKIVND